MRRYDIVSGILLILSIIDFAIAAPILVQEKRHASVDVVHIPKDVITVLGKRGEEDLAKLAEEFAKTWGKPIDSSGAHTSSSSAPAGPDHESTDVMQGPAPNPASSTANPGLLMEPSSPSSTAAIPDSYGDLYNYNAAWDDKVSNKGSDTSMEPLFTPGSSAYGSDDEWAMQKLPPIRIPGPSPGADPNFNWDYWRDAPSPQKPSSPNDFGLAPEYQMGHVQEPDAGPSTGADPDFNWDYWRDAPSPQKPSSPIESGLAPEYQMGHVQEPDAGPSTGADPDFNWDYWRDAPSPPKPSSPNEFGPAPKHQVGDAWVRPSTGPDPDLDSNRWVSLDDLMVRPASAKEDTAPAHPDTDSDPNLMAAHQPPPYPLSWTDFGNDHDANQPLAYAPAATDFYSYSYPGSVNHPPLPGTGSSTVPEHEEVTPPSPGAGLPTVPEHEDETPSSPNLGSPKEAEHEVVPGPPSTPESTDPEDPQSLSAGVQPEDLRAAMYANEDLQAAIYAAKGKGKESRSIAGTARVVGNAAQRELQPAEWSP
jgi:hypothetical protein